MEGANLSLEDTHVEGGRKHGEAGKLLLCRTVEFKNESYKRLLRGSNVKFQPCTNVGQVFGVFPDCAGVEGTLVPQSIFYWNSFRTRTSFPPDACVLENAIVCQGFAFEQAKRSHGPNNCFLDLCPQLYFWFFCSWSDLYKYIWMNFERTLRMWVTF